MVWERCEEAYVRESEGVEFVGGGGVGGGLRDNNGMGEGSDDGGQQGYMWHEVAVDLD